MVTDDSVSGLVLGIRFRRSPLEKSAVLRALLLLAPYSSLPALSFLSVPVVTAMGGWSVLDASEGARFGIPGFVPWPIDTILGFCLLVAGTGAIAKTAITTGIGTWMLARRRSRVSAPRER